MSSFSRSLRSPSYLSARRRPTMPGRTVSGSSDLSMASDDGADRLPSGQTTPTLSYQSRRYGSSHQPTSAVESAPAAPRGESNFFSQENQVLFCAGCFSPKVPLTRTPPSFLGIPSLSVFVRVAASFFTKKDGNARFQSSPGTLSIQSHLTPAPRDHLAWDSCHSRGAVSSVKTCAAKPAQRRWRH